MIGTLDSARTQVVMETLLQRIVETGASVAIIDITGVPTVDTLVAQHLLKTVTAARLMGADCIISGIRPQIAADDRAPRRGPERRDHQGDAGRRVRARARADRTRGRPRGQAELAGAHGTHPDPQDGRPPPGDASRWTCTTGSR